MGTLQENTGATENRPSGISRRNFVKGAATATAVAAAIPLQPLLGGRETTAEASVAEFNPAKRTRDSFDVRVDAAKAERINVGLQADNGDADRFKDGSGSYTKALKHDALGVTNAAAFQSLIEAFEHGKPEDFDEIIIGTPAGGPNSKFNGPQVALAFDLEGLDSHATIVPAAPSVTSNITAAEEVEHYWGALLRDVNFADYATNPMVAEAVADMNNLSFINSPQNFEYPHPITPQNLFRGQIVPGDGNVLGPYVSQFMVQPTSFGAQPLSQMYSTFLPGDVNEFMTSPIEFQLIQNGGDSGRLLSNDPVHRFVRNGRDLSAYTHVDVLHQAYFVAFLVMGSIGVPLNPGNPYNHAKTEKAFATLGGPDAAGTISEMATRALKASWYHKWIKDLRMRPEEYAGIVQARLTNSTPAPQSAAHLHPDVLNSAALAKIHTKFGSFLLPQAFPEGSPTHPCYPTGHGTVAGACVTAIKFFFDCNQKIRPFLLAHGRDVAVPSSDGLSLNTYTGADRDSLDINGELNKLCWNISTGHGIHAGIHFRSSTLSSILLGEQVALSVLQDRANTYNEKFTINITKLDGTIATISNQ